MPLTVYQVCFLVSSPLLLLLCFTTSCTGSPYEDCHWSTCGNYEVSYPFGKINSGCGDPQFQLNCTLGGYPLLNIGGDEYLILLPLVLDRTSLNIQHMMTIVNYNLWGKCNPLGNYSQVWWPASPFRIADGYTNLTLWGHCNESAKGRSFHTRRLCGEDWYIISNPETGKRFCQTNLRLPVKNNFSITWNEELSKRLLQGFEITWYDDKKRDRSCDACSKSGGSCGYNISEPSSPFLCYCPDGTSQPEICPANHIGRKHKLGIVIGCIIGGVALTAIAVLSLMFYANKRRPSPVTSTSVPVKRSSMYG